MQRCADGDEGGDCGRGANTEEIFRTFDEEHSSARETRSPRGVFAEFYAILHEYTLALHASTGSEQDLLTLDALAQAAAVAYARGLANVPQVSFNPGAVLSTAAVYLGKGVMQFASTVFVSTPNGFIVNVPSGWVPRPADNGMGVVFQQPGSIKNANSMRIMYPGADARYPAGYVKFYNEYGQPLTANGVPGSRPDTHIPLDYNGPLIGWPK